MPNQPKLKRTPDVEQMLREQERARDEARNKSQIVVLHAHADALRWVLGLPNSLDGSDEL